MAQLALPCCVVSIFLIPLLVSHTYDAARNVFHKYIHMKKVMFSNRVLVVTYLSFVVRRSWIHGIFYDAGDSLSYHANHPFSTKDEDRDNDEGKDHCAQVYKGGWWYVACHHCNLNGAYLGGSHTSYGDGIEWEHWHGVHYSLKTVTMKLKP